MKIISQIIIMKLLITKIPNNYFIQTMTCIIYLGTYINDIHHNL